MKIKTISSAPPPLRPYDPRAWGARCDICPLRGKFPVPPKGPFDAPMALIGEAPGFHEDRAAGQGRGAPLIGPSGVKLDELLFKAKIKRSQLWVTNALMCRVESPQLFGKKRWEVNAYMAAHRLKNKQLKKAKQPQIPSPFECCRPRLELELSILETAAVARGAPNGLVVVPMGNWALETTTGKKGIAKQRGGVLQPKLE